MKPSPTARTAYSIALLGIFAPAWAGLPAFPGAVGPGADATGGRGGDVYHVTSLVDDAEKPGTLRHGIKTAPQTGRTIVFDVAGVIHLQPPGRKGWLDIPASNLTIAGQTAPYPGITIIGQATKMTGKNVILRNIHFRPGKDQLRPGQATNDGITSYLQNSIIDHCSVTWADDEAISVTDDASNTTVQYCLMAEGLNYKGHSYGSLISSDHNDAKVSYHHNLYAHNKSRLPRLGSEKGSGVILNFSNNVIYDWSGKGGYSANDVNSRKPLPNRTNFIANYYIAGPSNKDGDSAFDGANAETVINQHGNLLDANRNGKFDGTDVGWELFTGTFSKADKPFDVIAGPIQPAEEALTQVLAHAGAFWWQRDSIDERIVKQVRTQTGKMINEVDEVGGFPKVDPVSRPANFDADQDGMADEWEAAHGMDPKTADDKGDLDNDGYTNLEEYLNDIAAFPSPTPIRFTAMGGRFEQASNWDNAWQPSRYDQAVIDAGVVTLDSPGQAARMVTVTDIDMNRAELRLNADATMNLVIDGGILTPGVARLHGGLVVKASTVRFELTSPDKFSKLSIDGDATLNGSIDVKLLDGFEPKPGDKFEVLTAKKVSGAVKSASPKFSVQLLDDKLVLTAK